jgi:predicted esterase
MKEGDNGEIPSLPIPGSIFIKYVQNNGDIHLIPKSGEYKYVFIFLHGLHDSPGRFVQKFGELRDPIFNSFKIIIPNAPKQRVNTYNGEIINSWFSIHRDKEDTSPFQEEEEVDFKELIKTSSKIKKIIFEEVYYKLHRDFSKIFIGGFSEGACLAYHIGLTLNHILGGIISFCGIPLKTTKKLPDNGMNLNILAILGGKDPMFPLNEAKHQIKSLIAGNNNLLIKEFPFSGHQVTDDENRSHFLYALPRNPLLYHGLLQPTHLPPMFDNRPSPCHNILARGRAFSAIFGGWQNLHAANNCLYYRRIAILWVVSWICSIIFHLLG